METTVTKQTGEPLWFKLQRWYFWTRQIIGVVIFVTLGWSFLELVGPGRVLREALVAEIQSTFPFNLFVKEDPAKIEAEARRIAIESIQARCSHIWERNGLKNHFCPLCGKKILPGDYPLWQI